MFLKLLLFFVAAFLSTPSVMAQERITFLYPSVSGTWLTPMIAKEAKYFDEEGLFVELVRMGGGARIVQGLLGGSAQVIHAGEPTVVAAVAGGSDAVIIAVLSHVPEHFLIARPEMAEVKDLKGRTVGVTTFGSTSDFILGFALKQYGLDPDKDVSIVQTGGQPEGFAALMAGRIYAQRMSFPLVLKAFKLGMRNLVDFSKLGLEENKGPVITTRSYIARHRNTLMKFMKAHIRALHRYRTDKEFTKKVLTKYSKIQDEEILEGTWRNHAKTILRVPRASLKSIQQLIDYDASQGKKMNLRPEQVVDLSLVEELERSGFIDSLYK